MTMRFSAPQGRHTKTGQLAAIKVMDVTEASIRLHGEARLNYFLTLRGSQCYGTWLRFAIEELELRSRDRFLRNKKSFA